ncbi:hypothetical protein ABW20_dc0108165 [Dactylellina cionopaga]|nr:hypothetical protein ABW20_dc0108165 [Dactylellina cionopaga]
MFPVPFQSSVLSGNDEAASTASIAEVHPVVRERLDASKTAPQVKMSRFSRLFSRDSATEEAPLKKTEDSQPEGQSQDIPRYKAPKNGQGSKAPPPTPPAAFCDPNPKRLYMDNVPYAARKQDIVTFFDGFKVDCVDIPKKRDGRLRGVAYVNLATSEEAKNAVIHLNGTNFKGRRVRIMHAKVSSNHRKSQPELEKDIDTSQHRDSPGSSELRSTQSVPYSCGPIVMISDNGSSLRQDIFNLSCQAITRGEKTPDEIFREVNFNNEEKMMLRDFYFCYKRAERSMVEKLELPCSTHGLTQCMECHQALLIQQIRNEEQKENFHGGTSKTLHHHHSLSWDSGITLQGQSSPEFPSRQTSSALTRRTSLTQSTAYPALSMTNALRLYGPKFVKENFPQTSPPVHNTYIPFSRGNSLEHPFQRQHSIIPTQPGIKTHCAFFLRTGHCDFAQQGCKFSHELPPGGITELTTRSTSLTTSTSGPFGPPRNGLGGSVYAESVALPRRLTHVSTVRAVSGPVHAIKRSDSPYSELGSNTSSMRSSYPVLNARIQFDDSISGARRRLTGQNSQQQRQTPKLWRDVTSWRDHMKHSDDHTNETDGAADDEDSDSDLISLSSYEF